MTRGNLRGLRGLGAASLVSCALCCGCVGTTGAESVDFDAAAAGPAEAHAGSALDFETGLGWQVSLTTARLHVGAVYLDDTQPASGAQPTSCILPGTYVAQVTDGLDVDLLSGTPQKFPSRGHGTTLLALSAQVWLTEGPVDDLVQPANTYILTLVGTASRAADVRPFSAKLTISAANRQPNDDTSQFANPICKQRVVSPIPTSVRVEDHGGLLLRVDPRLLFVNVDFAALSATTDSANFVFSDDSSDQPSYNLYQNLRSTGGLYSFSWAADAN